MFDYEWASKSQASIRIDELRSAVKSCQISRNGVPNRFGGNTHPAEVLFIVGDFEAATEALKSDHIEMTKGQQFDLVSFAVTHQDPTVLDLVLTSGVDPRISEPDSGVTTIMHASQSAYSAVERMKRLASLGVDALAVSRDGFSALDFSIADGEEAAVEQVLSWIDDDFSSSKDLVLFAIDIAERTEDDLRAKQLQDWLATRAETVLE